MSGPVFGEFGQYWGKSSQTLKYAFELLGFENLRLPHILRWFQDLVILLHEQQ